MKIQILVSTMNLKNNEELIKKMNIRTESITINQITDEKIKPINNLDSDNKVYSYYEKGLSKSRNKAIVNSNADICVIADDDLTYEDDYEKKIIDAYEKYKDADIIAFYVESKTKDRPTSKQREGRIKYLKSLKIASFQITFKKKSIIEKNIIFDSEFGAGSGKYNLGEENIFLYDCLRKKCKIYFIPINIAYVEHTDSTWFFGYDKNYFISKGACYYRMSKLMCDLLIIQFAVRKYKLYKNEVKLKNALKYMFEGKRRKKKYNDR